jgi:GntR family transcriptional regulator
MTVSQDQHNDEWRMASRRAYERRRRQHAIPLATSSIRRTYDLLRSQLPMLDPGDLLVEADLVRSLSSSRGAVRAALQLLADEGLVTRKTKVGTRVERTIHLPFTVLIPDVDKGALYGMSAQVQTSIIAAPEFLQDLFKLDSGSSVAMIEGQMFYGPDPIGLSVSYVPLTVAQADRAEVLSRSTLGVIDFVEQRLDLPLQASRARLGALACDAETASKLTITNGSPMLWLEQIFVDADGRERAILHARYRGDRVAFSGDMQRRWPASVPRFSEMPKVV